APPTTRDTPRHPDYFSHSIHLITYPPLPTSLFLFFSHTATTEIYTLSLHDALPIWPTRSVWTGWPKRSLELSMPSRPGRTSTRRSEEHTSELQSLRHLVCRLLLEKKKKQ